MKRNLTFVCLCVAAALLSGCATTSPVPSMRPAEVLYPPLRVGIAPQFTPIIYQDEGRPTGLEVDFATALAAALERDIEFVALPPEHLIPALEADRIDIVMSGLTVTKSRERRVAFAQPYFAAGLMALVRSTDAQRFRYPRIIQFSPVRIGTEVGSAAHRFVERECRKARSVPFPSCDAAADALKHGSVDLVIADAPTIWQLAAQHGADGLAAEPTPLTNEYLAWAVRKGNTDLLRRVNAVQAKWVSDGTLRDFLLRWLP